MIAYQIGRTFTVVDYVNDDAHREDLDLVTNLVADALMDTEDNIVTDSDVSVDLGRGHVEVSVLVKVADEGAADTIALRRMREAFAVADVRAPDLSAPTTRLVELV